LPARRIIPCLDVLDGRVVKGIRFRNHRDAGDIVGQAIRYRDEGADELVFYDIAASAEGRTLSLEWVRKIAAVLDIPFTVAGGLRTVKEGAACLEAGADKLSINSPAL
jgi:cyclase